MDCHAGRPLRGQLVDSAPETAEQQLAAKGRFNLNVVLFGADTDYLITQSTRKPRQEATPPFRRRLASDRCRSRPAHRKIQQQPDRDDHAARFPGLRWPVSQEGPQVRVAPLRPTIQVQWPQPGFQRHEGRSRDQSRRSADQGQPQPIWEKPRGGRRHQPSAASETYRQRQHDIQCGERAPLEGRQADSTRGFG